MALSRDDIKTVVIKSLLLLIAEKGVPEIGEGTDPIHELGLTSKDGLDLACILSDKLGYVIPDDLNPLVDDKRRSRTVKEVIDFLFGLMEAAAKGAAHE